MLKRVTKFQYALKSIKSAKYWCHGLCRLFDKHWVMVSNVQRWPFRARITWPSPHRLKLVTRPSVDMRHMQCLIIRRVAMCKENKQ